MSTDQLSMSMFATRADYDAAVLAQADDEPRAPVVTGSPDTIWLCYGDLDRDATHRECVEVMWCEDKQHPSDVRYVRADAGRVVPTPEGLRLAVKLLAQIGDDDSDAAIAAVHAACDLAQRVADLEAANAALLERVGTIEGDNQRLEAERDELRARLAEIEAQEPVAISKAGNLFWAGNPQDWRGVDCSLYAAPMPAQAAPMSDERIDAIAELVIKGMPDGICGFVRGWGWQHFARELLDVCAGHYRAAPAQAVPYELLKRCLLVMETNWTKIDDEWGSTDGGIEADIAAGYADEIRDLRKFIAAAPEHKA